MAVFTWLEANWMGIAIALLAVDRMLIQLFPSNTIFQSVQNFLLGVGAK